MSLLTRRIVFYLLLTFFVIIAPLIVGYTAGYRYSFKQHRLVKTGALSIESIPDGANILLNGKPYKDRTSALITNIIPGNYQITLERGGYYTWQKTLAVESEKTTFAHNIPLFKKTIPQLTDKSFSRLSAYIHHIPQNFKQYKVFHDKKLNKIVVIDNDNQIRLAELNGDKTLWRKKGTPLLFTFSDHEVWQFNPGQKTTTLITRLIDNIQTVIALPKVNAILLVFDNRIQAIELDPRDKQNNWTLAEFDTIKNATLMDDNKTLQIAGLYENKEGVWTLELR